LGAVDCCFDWFDGEAERIDRVFAAAGVVLD
jgi:hypothetical protein